MTVVLVAGATGMLGSRIAHHLLDTDGVTVRLMARTGWADDPGRRATIEPLVDRGAVIVEADLTEPDSLITATAGAGVVVSAVQGGRDIIVDGQTALARAAAANGVTRFLPSDFAIDLFAAPPGAPQFEARKEADAAIDAMPLDVLHVLSGAFLDRMLDPAYPGLVDVPGAAVHFWGTGDEVFDLTTVDDTAAFTARLATDASAQPGVHSFSGAQTSFRAIAAAVAEVSGTRLVPQSWGSVEDLRQVIEAKGGSSSWDAAMEWYFLALLTTPPLDRVANDRYPDLRLTGLPDYVAAAYAPGSGA